MTVFHRRNAHRPSHSQMRQGHNLLARSILAGLLWAMCFSNCAVSQRRSVGGSPEHAFIVYWPRHGTDRQLCLAIKDNIDMKGVVTTEGSEYLAKSRPPATRDAGCLAIAREQKVQIVGKTNLSEFAVAPSGLNEYFGTPKNPFSKLRKLIPGGSSSGSAVAVARGMADIAFGTDTAGSIRVPAACCGIVGLKTTFGLVSLNGVAPIAPKRLDTVGPMARDVDHVVEGMELLQKGFAARYRSAVAAKPLAKNLRIGRLYLSGTDPEIDTAVDHALARCHFQVVTLDKTFRTKWNQAKADGDTVAAAGVWIHYKNYFGKLGVSAKTEAIIALGEFEYTVNYRAALRRQTEWKRTLSQVLRKVDLIALPTLQTLPPTIPLIGRTFLLEARVANLQNTVAVNFAGNPALAIPIPVRDGAVPVTSLQLVGRPFSEAELLNAGHLVEATIQNRIPEVVIEKPAHQ